MQLRRWENHQAALCWPGATASSLRPSEPRWLIYDTWVVTATTQPRAAHVRMWQARGKQPAGTVTHRVLRDCSESGSDAFCAAFPELSKAGRIFPFSPRLLAPRSPCSPVPLGMLCPPPPSHPSSLGSHILQPPIPSLCAPHPQRMPPTPRIPRGLFLHHWSTNFRRAGGDPVCLPGSNRRLRNVPWARTFLSSE